MGGCQSVVMVTSSRLPVLWLCGAPGTGKSTVAWQVFGDLAGQGLGVGYLDIDQIGMLQPPPDGDPSCHRFKVDNLAGMVRNYRAAGTQVLVISGVIDPERGPDFAEAAADADITFCHLTVDEQTLRERLAARGWPSEAADEAMTMMSGLAEAPFVTTTIDTTGRDPVGLAREAATSVTAAPSDPGAQELPECSVGDVTIIIGPRAVGKSSVSWGMAMRRWVSGERTAYVDLDQVGLLRPEPLDTSLQAANLGAIWRNALSRGANRLIANGMVSTNEDLSNLRHAVRPAPVRALRLTASPEALWNRIRDRSTGSPARLINDDLENAAPDVQRHVHRAAVGQNVEYAASNLGDDVIDTTSLGIEEAVCFSVPSESDQRSGPVDAQARDDLNRIAAYLARRDIASLSPAVVPRADVLVLCGSAVMAEIDIAATAFHDGLADRLLVSGGVGHSTPYLRRAVREDQRYRDVPTDARPESAIIAEILRRHHAVPDDAILIEDESTNCGENARFSVDLLTATPLRLQSVLLLQDPTMQRRTHECFRRSLRDADGVRVLSYAPFVPTVPDPNARDARNVHDEDGHTVWSVTRFTTLLLGEMRRLHDDEQGYGPRGADFIDHVDIPGDVMDAYQRVAVAHPQSVREPWHPAGP
jgi:uncharacterized SAM-binding protein YcdF (DUF218 family)/predicted kinase